MLHAALTALLALQSASGSPNLANPTSPSQPGAAATAPETQTPPDESNPAPTPTRPAPSPTRTPAPRRGQTTPGPKAGSNESLLVVNKSDSSLSILDAGSGKTRFTVPVDDGPHEVEMLGDGRVAAVSSYGRRDAPGRFVSLVELGTGKVVMRIDLGEGARPHGLKALSDGRLLVTTEGKKELAVVSPRDGKVTARYPTGRDVSHLVAASPDGKRAFVSSLSPGSVTVIDLQTGKVIKDIPTGKGAEGIDVTPDGREVWVANRDANTITVIDVKMLAPVFTIPASEFPIRVKITPDGRSALATFTGTGDVRVYDTATRVEKARIPLGRDAVEGSENRVFQKRFGTSSAPVGLLISPDGKRAFVSAAHADVVAVIDLERNRVDDAWVAGKEPDGLAMAGGAPPTPPPLAAPTTPPPPGMRRPTIARRPG